MKSLKLAVVLALAFAPGIFATGIPVLTSTQWQLTYTTNASFTGAYTPSTAVVNSGGYFYGTPAVAGGNQSHLDVFNETGAGPLCYGVGCASPETYLGQPAYYFTIGNWGFFPQNIVPGTGVSSLGMQTTFTASLEHQNQGAPFPSGFGTATLYTGLDPGGTSDYYYFVNADGTVTDTLHVPIGQTGDVFLGGVVYDPPNSPTLTLDITGFGGPNGNETIPEPGNSGLAAIAIIGLAVVPLLRRRRA